MAQPAKLMKSIHPRPPAILALVLAVMFVVFQNEGLLTCTVNPNIDAMLYTWRRECWALLGGVPSQMHDHPEDKTKDGPRNFLLLSVASYLVTGCSRIVLPRVDR
jgi:hypothetical protein